MKCKKDGGTCGYGGMCDECDEAGLSAVEPVVMCVLLAEKHNGMKISASGILRRVGGHLRPGAQEMLKHLNEMASRFYAGDVKAVDEFLQLYCLDGERPST